MNTRSVIESRPLSELPLTAVSPSRPYAPVGLVIAAFAAVYLIWGSTYLGIRVAIDSIPPLLMAGTRFIIAGSVLYAVMRLRGVPRPEPGHWKSAAIIGSLLLLAGNGGVCWAQQTVPSGVTALIVAAVPLWILLVEWLRRGGQRPTLRVVLGVIIGMAGVAIIISSRNALGHPVVNPIAAVVLVGANICWAFGSVYSRQASRPQSPLLAIAMQMLTGGALQLLAGLMLGEGYDFDPSHITAASAWAFAYLTLIGSLVGFTAYVWLLQVSTPARVSTHAYVNPLVAVLLGHFILSEPFPQSILLAGALILAAVILITRPSRS
ncbi:MAG: EamA family transporter [Prosthecobacter sp.]|nr:EamA family transporter [Prosthecobacter sp.]